MYCAGTRVPAGGPGKGHPRPDSPYSVTKNSRWSSPPTAPLPSSRAVPRDQAAPGPWALHVNYMVPGALAHRLYALSPECYTISDSPGRSLYAPPRGNGDEVFEQERVWGAGDGRTSPSLRPRPSLADGDCQGRGAAARLS